MGVGCGRSTVEVFVVPFLCKGQRNLVRGEGSMLFTQHNHGAFDCHETIRLG